MKIMSRLLLRSPFFLSKQAPEIMGDGGLDRIPPDIVQEFCPFCLTNSFGPVAPGAPEEIIRLYARGVRITLAKMPYGSDY
jgi:hypothetical protein